MDLQPQQLFSLIVLLGTLLVFVSDSIGNMLAFGNRFVNAFTTAIVWGVLFFMLYFVLGAVEIKLASDMSRLVVMTAVGSGIVFVADMIGNVIAFGNRFLNSLITAIIWATMFVALRMYGFV